MPSVPQLDWSKLSPEPPKQQSTLRYHLKSARSKKQKRVGLKDKRILSEGRQQLRHLSDIMREER